MTWIAESSGMWFPHQVRKLVAPLDTKIEQLQRANEMLGEEREAWKRKAEKLQRELEDARDAVTTAMLIGSDTMKNCRKYHKANEDAINAGNGAWEPAIRVKHMLQVLCEARKC